jgi:uncharacterized protein YcbK (DUF882 family)
MGASSVSTSPAWSRIRGLRRLVAIAVAAITLRTAIGAAQPPSKAKKLPPLPPPAAAIRPGSPAAIAYMAGKQPLVGWHAPSTKSVAADASGRPMLCLTTLNRSETVDVPAITDEGGFAASDLDRVGRALRAAGGEEHPVDPRTLGLVYRIQRHFAVPEIRVVSGYRVPKPGSHSNHGKGRAIDLVVPGVPDEDVARFVRELGFTGVGVYPTSQFVHVDIRPRSYFWVDYSGPRMKNRETGILGDLAARADASAVARGEAPIEPFAIGSDVDAALRARGMTPASMALPAEEEDDDEN